MSKNLFKPVSPLLGWFILMEVLSGLCIIGYWAEFFRSGAKPWQPGPGIGVLFTGLFVGANVLMFRNRWLAAAGFAAGWLILALALSAI